MPSNVIEGWGNKSTTDAEVTGDVDATISGISLTKFSSKGTNSSVPDNTVVTVHSQAFVAGSFENLVIVSVSGSTHGKFYLRKNSVVLDVRRTSPDRNLQFDFTGAPYRLVSGDVIDIQVEHFHTGIIEEFDATIYGYEN